MSDSPPRAAGRPRPKPRARARVTAAAADSSSSASAETARRKTALPLTVEDDDDFFNRNRGAMWKRQAGRAGSAGPGRKASVTPTSTSPSTSAAPSLPPAPNTKRPSTSSAIEILSSDEDAPPSRRPSSSEEDDDWDGFGKGRKKKKKVVKAPKQPSWIDNKGAINLSSDEETPTKKRRVDTDDDEFATPVMPKPSAPTRKREASLTPPPPVNEMALLNARNVVRRAISSHLDNPLLQTSARSSSPPRPGPPLVLEEDDDDLVELDPALAEIRKRARERSRAHRETSTLSIGESSDVGGERERERRRVRGAPEVVEIGVRWRLHPERVGHLRDEERREMERVKMFKINRGDSFDKMFKHISGMTGILAEQLVVSHNNARVFPGATPDTLEIFARASFDAQDKETFEYLRAQRKAQSVARFAALSEDPVSSVPTVLSGVKTTANGVLDISDSSSDVGILGSSSPVRPGAGAASAPAPPADDNDDDGLADGRLRLTLRARSGDDFKVQVAPHQKVRALLVGYLKHAGLGVALVEKGARLELDGERLDNDGTVGDAGMEDEDLINVILP